jgi:hypothetical protein
MSATDFIVNTVMYYGLGICILFLVAIGYGVLRDALIDWLTRRTRS